MQKKRSIPTPLISREERERIVIDDNRVWKRHSRIFYILSCLLRLAFRLFWTKVTGRLTPQVTGVIMRESFQRMDMLWIKIGQLLSLRADVFSVEFCDELSKLQDQAHGFSPEISIRVLEQELGAPIDFNFDRLIGEPFAAASISQVHRGFLRREQVWVAVKVRKPNAVEIFESDVRVIADIVSLLRWFSVKPHMRWQDILWEIRQVMIEELDYDYEATNLKRMRKSLRAHKIYVPKVFEDYSTKQVLVMEYVEGVLMSDYLKIAHNDPGRLRGWLKTNNVDPVVLGRRLFYSGLRQFFEDNLFHSDLHPGNILILRDSRVAYIDFGSIGFMDRDFLEKYDIYLEAMIKKQYSKVFDIYLLFPDSIPSVNIGKLKEEFIVPLQAWQERCAIKSLSYDEKAFSSVNDEFLRLLGKYRITMTWTFLRFTRAAITLDAALRELIPREDMNTLIENYFKRREKRRFKQLLSKAGGAAVDGQQILEFPIKLNESMIFRGTIIRRVAQVFDRFTTKATQSLDDVVKLLIVSIRAFVLYLFLVYLGHEGIVMIPAVQDYVSRISTWFPVLDTQIWAAILVMVLYTDRLLVGLRNRFREL